MQDFVIKEAVFAKFMKDTVEPFLAGRRKEFRIPREADKAIYCVSYVADAPKGTVMISHGFTETAEKYLEPIYYLVKHGYNVYQSEHCGHGRSYRLVEDLSLVHVDRYERYVADLLAVAEAAKQAYPQMPLFLFGHSMGGGIAAAALSLQPELFVGAVLSSPMIRPLTGTTPWPVAKLLAKLLCRMGKAKQYLPGGHAYDGKERFEDSASTSRERFAYYQIKRSAQPLFQMNAASCGWLNETARLNRYLMSKGWKQVKTPLLIFQAQDDTFVSAAEQDRFVEKVKAAGKAPVRKLRIDSTKHEIFSSEDRVLQNYWNEILMFLQENNKLSDDEGK